MSQKPHLISFKLCPFVQRSVITLLHKGVDFDMTYIDLANKPDWFLDISPLGKVPVLRVGETSLFESAVINEYLDETEGEPLHPQDALKRGLNRSWIEFGSSMIGDHYLWSTTTDEAAFERHGHALRGKYERFESILGDGPFFNGAKLSLVDTALAPLLMRQALIDGRYGRDLLRDLSKMQAYSKALLELPAVKGSVVENFDTLFLAYISDKNPRLAQNA